MSNIESLLTILTHYITQANQGNVLSCTELAKGTKYSTLDVFKFMNRGSTAAVLKKSGLRPPKKVLEEEHLTLRQQRVITHVVNPYTKKPLNLLLAEQKVSMEEWRQWLTRPHFRNAYNSRVVREVTTVKGEIVRRTAQKATEGDQKAVENYFRIIDEPLPELSKASAGSNTIELTDLSRVLQQVLPPALLKDVVYALMNRDNPLPELEAESVEVESTLSKDFGSEAGDPDLDPV